MTEDKEKIEGNTKEEQSPQSKEEQALQSSNNVETSSEAETAEVVETPTPEETSKTEVTEQNKEQTSNSRVHDKRNMSIEERRKKDSEEAIEDWKPKTILGKKVKEGLITDIEDIFQSREKILEAEIVDILLPSLETDLLLIGQAKGKFGGGKRRIFRQTQKKTNEGNKLHFTTCALVGNKNGFVGVNVGKSKETVPARDKSIRKAKLNLMKVRRGCGSWECTCGESHSIPFSVEGKCGSSTITLIPAPKGKGLCVEKECAKILKMAGIKDVWSKTKGQTKTKLNLIKALVKAMERLSEVKIKPEHTNQLGIADGEIKPEGTEDMKEFAESTNKEQVSLESTNEAEVKEEK